MHTAINSGLEQCSCTSFHFTAFLMFVDLLLAIHIMCVDFLLATFGSPEMAIQTDSTVVTILKSQ